MPRARAICFRAIWLPFSDRSATLSADMSMECGRTQSPAEKDSPLKLRIRRNSIRLRLGESEVAKLVSTGRVTESIQFSAPPEGRLQYTLVASPDATQIAADFALNEITLTVPVSLAQQWGNSAEVGMTHEQPIGNGAHLTILIEKDFNCLAPRPGEDESDTFANPGMGHPTHGKG